LVAAVRELDVAMPVDSTASPVNDSMYPLLLDRRYEKYVPRPTITTAITPERRPGPRPAMLCM
jgi:hypothetical protein